MELLLSALLLMCVDEAHTITRAECLERYREKKLRRLDVNTIRYMKRKINADRRPRAFLSICSCRSCD